ncbi:unnamed protein product [Sphagnum compactum]
MRSLGTQACVGDERRSWAPWLLGEVPLFLRILFVNWPQPAANAVTSVVRLLGAGPGYVRKGDAGWVRNIPLISLAALYLLVQ